LTERISSDISLSGGYSTYPSSSHHLSKFSFLKAREAVAVREGRAVNVEGLIHATLEARELIRRLRAL